MSISDYHFLVPARIRLVTTASLLSNFSCFCDKRLGFQLTEGGLPETVAAAGFPELSPSVPHLRASVELKPDSEIIMLPLCNMKTFPFLCQMQIYRLWHPQGSFEERMLWSGSSLSFEAAVVFVCVLFLTSNLNFL